MLYLYKYRQIIASGSDDELMTAGGNTGHEPRPQGGGEDRWNIHKIQNLG